MANLKLKNPSGGSLNLVSADGASDLTVTFPATTGTAMVSGNMPAFSAYQGSTQTLTGNVYTKIALNTERFDTNNNFNTSNGRFAPTVAGYYQINYEVYATTSSTITQFIGALYKNGSTYEYGVITSLGGAQAFSASTLVYMNGSTDYLELYINVNGTGTLSATEAGGTTNFMSGVLVRAA